MWCLVLGLFSVSNAKQNFYWACINLGPMKPTRPPFAYKFPFHQFKFNPYRHQLLPLTHSLTQKHAEMTHQKNQPVADRRKSISDRRFKVRQVKIANVKLKSLSLSRSISIHRIGIVAFSFGILSVVIQFPCRMRKRAQVPKVWVSFLNHQRTGTISLRSWRSRTRIFSVNQLRLFENLAFSGYISF